MEGCRRLRLRLRVEGGEGESEKKGERRDRGEGDGWMGVDKPMRDQWLDEESGWLLCEFFVHSREDARWGLVFHSG